MSTRNLLLAVAVIAVGLAFWLLRNNSSDVAAGDVRTVTVDQLEQALASSEAFVLDVREPWEYAEAHLPGATLIPLGELSARLDELPRDQPLYVICRSGNRSRAASDLLHQSGFADVRNVDGGILAWQAKGYPTVR